MALDQTEKRRKLAKDVVTQATQLANAERTLIDKLEEATDAGLVFVDTDFEVDGLRHLDAATFNAIAGVITAVNTTLSANNRAHWKTLLKMIA
jgi:hypothetical protein